MLGFLFGLVIGTKTWILLVCDVASLCVLVACVGVFWREIVQDGMLMFSLLIAYYR